MPEPLHTNVHKGLQLQKFIFCVIRCLIAKVNATCGELHEAEGNASIFLASPLRAACWLNCHLGFCVTDAWMFVSLYVCMMLAFLVFCQIYLVPGFC